MTESLHQRTLTFEHDRKNNKIVCYSVKCKINQSLTIYQGVHITYINFTLKTISGPTSFYLIAALTSSASSHILYNETVNKLASI